MACSWQPCVHQQLSCYVRWEGWILVDNQQSLPQQVVVITGSLEIRSQVSYAPGYLGGRVGWERCQGPESYIKRTVGT